MSDASTNTHPSPEEGLEEALRDAFAGLMPEREAFLDGIRARVEEGQERDARQLERLEAASPRLRWAASLLPPGFVLGAASLAGKKVGVKALAGVIAMPAIAMLVLVGAFFGGVRSMRSASEAFPSTRPC